MAIKASGRFTATVQVPLTGKGAAILDETLIMAGVTQGTDLGLAIPLPVANAGADIVGKLLGAHATANDSLQTGATWTYREVELVDSIELHEFEYSLAAADLLAVTSFTGTTVTITSLENNADCGWLYVAAGSGIGQLLFCTAMNGGTATIKTAPAVALDNTSKVVKIHRFGHKVVNMNAASQFKSAAAAGVFTVFNFENYIDFQPGGITKQLLDPTKHDNLTLIPTGSGLKPKFTSRMAIRANAGR